MLQSFRWYDDTDTANILNAITPTYTDNLIGGGSTYGFWELLGYLDDFFYSNWIYLAEDCGLGIGTGLLIVSLSVRALFIPLAMYSQATGIKIKLLQPDQEEMTEIMKRHMKSGNREAAKIERQKMKRLRASHGIYPMFSFLNILQFPIHVVFISMINRLSYNYDIKPAILTDGFLWFTDLSSPDPYGVLPVIGGTITLLNILSTSTTNVNPMMRRIRRYMYFFPFITIPVWMTFPSAFNLYWM
jgi:YidC/Oxa1 family membrane protein insertase